MKKFKKTKTLALVVLALGFPLTSWSQMAPDITSPILTTEAWIPNESTGTFITKSPSGVISLSNIDEAGEELTFYSIAIDPAPSSGISDQKIRWWHYDSGGTLKNNGVKVWDTTTAPAAGGVNFLVLDHTLNFAYGDRIEYMSEATDTIPNPTTYDPVGSEICGNAPCATRYSFTVEENYTWAKAYGGIDFDESEVIYQVSDGYLIAGGTESFGVKKRDVYFAKVDQDGNFLWANAYGGNKDEYIRSLQQIPDGNYIATGWTMDSGGSGNKDFLVMKLSPLGVKIWARAFGGGSADFDSSKTTVYDASTGNLFVAGVSGIDASILKLDPNGHLLKMRNLVGSKGEFREIEKTSDGNYIAVGKTTHSDNRGNILVVKFDSNLVKIWAKEYGKNNLRDSAVSIYQTDDDGDGDKDDGYLVFGYLENVIGGPQDFFVMKINPLGIKKWVKSYKKADLDSDHSRFSCETSDGGFVLSVISFYTGGSNILLVKINSNGIQEWAKIFKGDDIDNLNFIEQTSDGGYIISGRTNSFGAGNMDTLIIKLDKNGNIKDCSPPLEDFGAIIPNSFITWAIIETVVADTFSDVAINESNLVFTTTPFVFSEENVCLACNTDPTVNPYAPTIPASWCNSSPGEILLSWEFKDTEDGDGNQTEYQIDLRKGAISCSSGRVISGDTSITAVNIPNCGGFVTYDDPIVGYDWDITVWDSTGASSTTKTGASFSTTRHKWPTVCFTYTPFPPPPLLQFEVITFDPGCSATYDGTPIDENIDLVWDWDYDSTDVGDPSFDTHFPLVDVYPPAPPTPPQVIYSFAKEKDYTVNLRVTDSAGYSCWASQQSAQKIVPIGENMPEWNETTP
ncbi:MAG: hypothetical protein U9N04_00015 [Patescibacteria group bacterium]|nr:hypothetical protein [Patescibacteria group bacterium]